MTIEQRLEAVYKKLEDLRGQYKVASEAMKTQLKEKARLLNGEKSIYLRVIKRRKQKEEQERLGI